MEKLILKRVLKVHTPEEIATIVKHRDNMLELEKTSHGNELEFIQREIFHCRRFMQRIYKLRLLERRRIGKL